ncbi:MAG: hypothetical protein ACRC62_26020 [Microcoleus sp.]
MPKIPKGTPRVAVTWGTDTVTTSKDGKTKKTKKVVTSMVFENIVKIFNLPKAAGAAGVKTKTITTKKGPRKVIDGAATSSVSPKYIMASTGAFDVSGKDQGSMLWHRIPVPASISLADIVDTLKATGKVYAVKWPRGKTYIISTDRDSEPGGSTTKGASR